VATWVEAGVYIDPLLERHSASTSHGKSLVEHILSYLFPHLFKPHFLFYSKNVSSSSAQHRERIDARIRVPHRGGQESMIEPIV